MRQVATEDRLKEIVKQLQEFDDQSEELLLQFVDRLSDLLEALKKQIYLWKDDCLERGQHFQQAFLGMEALVNMASDEALDLMRKHGENVQMLLDLPESESVITKEELHVFLERINKEFVKLSTLLEESDVRSSPFLTSYRDQISKLIQHMEDYALAACRLASSTSESVMYAIQEVQFQDLISQSIGHVVNLLNGFQDYVTGGGIEGSLFSVNLLRLAHGILKDIEYILQDANVIFTQQVFIVERFFLRIDGQHKKLSVQMSAEDKEDSTSVQTEDLLSELVPIDRSYLNYLASKTKILNTYYKLFTKIHMGKLIPEVVKIEGFIIKMSDQVTSEYHLYQDARQSASEGMVDIFVLTKSLIHILTQGDKEIATIFEPKVKCVHDDASNLERYCNWIALLRDNVQDVLSSVEAKHKALTEADIKDDWEKKKEDFYHICERFTIASHKQIGANIAGFKIDEGIMSGDVVLF